MATRYPLLLLILLWFAGSASARDSVRVLTIVDVSQDMQQSEVVERLDHARDWIERLPFDGHFISLMAYDVTARQITPFVKFSDESARGRLLTAMDTLTPQISANRLDAALEDALKIFDSRQALENKVLLWPGNLEGENGQVSPAMQDALDRYLKHDIAIYVVVPPESKNLYFWRSIAADTQGNLFLADDPRLFQKLHLALFNVVLPPDGLPQRKGEYILDESAEHLIFALAKKQANDGFVVHSPSGEQWLSRDAKEIERVHWYQTPRFVLLRVDDPATGKWGYETTLSSASDIHVWKDLELKVTIEDQYLERGQAIVLSAWLGHGEQIINMPRLWDNLKFQARLFVNEEDEPRLLGTLYDEGVQPDEAPGDGVFAGRFIGDFGEGPRTLEITASHPVLQRTKDVDLYFEPDWFHVTLEKMEGVTDEGVVVSVIVDIPAEEIQHLELNGELIGPDGTTQTFSIGPVDEQLYAEALPPFAETGDYSIAVTASGRRTNGQKIHKQAEALTYSVREPRVIADAGTDRAKLSAGVSAAPPLQLKTIFTLQIVSSAIAIVLLVFGGYYLRQSWQKAAFENIKAVLPSVEEDETEKKETSLSFKDKLAQRRKPADPFAEEIARLEAELGVTDSDMDDLEDLPDLSQDSDDSSDFEMSAGKTQTDSERIYKVEGGPEVQKQEVKYTVEREASEEKNAAREMEVQEKESANTEPDKKEEKPDKSERQSDIDALMCYGEKPEGEGSKSKDEENDLFTLVDGLSPQQDEEAKENTSGDAGETEQSEDADVVKREGGDGSATVNEKEDVQAEEPVSDETAADEDAGSETESEKADLAESMKADEEKAKP